MASGIRRYSILSLIRAGGDISISDSILRKDYQALNCACFENAAFTYRAHSVLNRVQGVTVYYEKLKNYFSITILHILRKIKYNVSLYRGVIFNKRNWKSVLKTELLFSNDRLSTSNLNKAPPNVFLTK